MGSWRTLLKGRRREFDTLAHAHDFEQGVRIVEKAKKVSQENWASNKHPGGYGN